MKYKLDKPYMTTTRMFVKREERRYGMLLTVLFEILPTGIEKELHSFFEPAFIDDKLDYYLYKEPNNVQEKM